MVPDRNGWLEEAVARFGLARDGLQIIPSFESLVAETKRAGQPVILKISDCASAPPGSVKAEVHWVSHLADAGVPVARPLPSQYGNLVELVGIVGTPTPSAAGVCGAAVLWEKAEGVQAWQAPRTPELFAEFGRIAGRVHAATQTYRPLAAPEIRPMWDELGYGFDAGRFLPPEQALAIRRCQELVARTRSLPRCQECFGLIHGDLHDPNFLVAGPPPGRVTLIDCADAHYGWFVSDIATALFHALRHPAIASRPQAQQDSFAYAFLSSFVAGYSSENALDPSWLGEIPHFLKLREMAVYLTLYAEGGFDSLDPWSTAFLVGRRASIESGAPIVELNIGRLRNLIQRAVRKSR